MRFRIVVILFLIMTSFIWKEKVLPDEYVQSYSANKTLFVKSVEGKDVMYTAKMIPAELRVIYQFKRGQINVEEAKELVESRKGEVEFILELEIPSNGNNEFLKAESDTMNYDERLSYFAFDFKEDIKIWIDNHVITLTDYHFERDFGVSPKGTFTFSVMTQKNEKTLIIEIDNKVYGDRIQAIEFDLSSLKTLPRLKNIKKWIKE